MRYCANQQLLGSLDPALRRAHFNFYNYVSRLTYMDVVDYIQCSCVQKTPIALLVKCPYLTWGSSTRQPDLSVILPRTNGYQMIITEPSPSG